LTTAKLMRQPPQTASHRIHIRHYKVLDHIDIMINYDAVNWPYSSSLIPYTHTPWRRLPPNPHSRPHHAGIVPLSALVSLLFCASTVALVAQALLPTMRWCHCSCCDVTIATVAVALASLPLLFVQAFSPSLYWRYALAPSPVFLVVQAFSPLLPTRMASQLKSFDMLPLLLHLLLSMYAASQWKRRTSFHWHSNPKQQAHQHDPIEVAKAARSAYLK
jgi:hypothetical protein